MAAVRALIFDMDGTMIDSMGHHRLSWTLFARRHAIEIEVDELMRRTTGRTGAECMNEFLDVARRLFVAPDHCIVFEDAPLGIEAARRAGMRAVAVCTSHRADELAGPHVLAAIDGYEDLAASAWWAAVAGPPRDTMSIIVSHPEPPL